MPLYRTLGTLLLTLAICWPVAAKQDQQEIRARLSEVRQAAQKISDKIYQNKRKETKFLKQLEDLDLSIGTHTESLRQAQDQKQQLSKKLQTLYQEKDQLQTAFDDHQKLLQILIQDSYGHFKHERLKMLLNQADWDSLARLDAYYSIIYSERRVALDKTKNYLKKVQANSQQIVKEQQHLKKLIHDIRIAQNKLMRKKQKREKVLASLRHDLQKQQKQQSSIKQQEEHLLGILKYLGKNKNTALPPHQSIASISKLKGMLTHPLHKQLKLTALAGKNKNFIAADIGTPVYAIHPGTVIFSQWLRGIGLLLIVDHGEGFLSLYGNNQILYKNLGDTVSENELIARVGESGTYGIQGLYFEIRKDGLALNSQSWLSDKFG